MERGGSRNRPPPRSAGPLPGRRAAAPTRSIGLPPRPCAGPAHATLRDGVPAPNRSCPDLVVVACADLDCDALGWLGLGRHEAHVMANAGGVVTDDALADLVSARRVLGVSRIVIVQHHPCALLSPGEPAGWPLDPMDRLRASLLRLVQVPLFLPAHAIRGVLGGAGGLALVGPPA